MTPAFVCHCRRRLGRCRRSRGSSTAGAHRRGFQTLAPQRGSGGTSDGQRCGAAPCRPSEQRADARTGAPRQLLCRSRSLTLRSCSSSEGAASDVSMVPPETAGLGGEEQSCPCAPARRARSRSTDSAHDPVSSCSPKTAYATPAWQSVGRACRGGPRYSTRWRHQDHIAAEVGGEHRRVPGVVLDEVGCGAESRRMGSGA
jgi:hypothetical protein